MTLKSAELAKSSVVLAKKEIEVEPAQHLKTCIICGKEFPVDKSRYDVTKYCSKKCSNAANMKLESNKGRKNYIGKIAYELDIDNNKYRKILYGYLSDGEIGVVEYGEWLNDEE